MLPLSFASALTRPYDLAVPLEAWAASSLNHRSMCCCRGESRRLRSRIPCISREVYTSSPVAPGDSQPVVLPPHSGSRYIQLAPRSHHSGQGTRP